MIKLSQTSKLGCKSWSLIARDTCPGSLEADGSLVPACAGCYAVGGNYRFANVKAPREFNREDWKRDDWALDMVEALKGETHFRWFDSGDLYALGLARKVYAVMLATPWVQHWLPTRMHKFQKFAEVLHAMGELPNVVVRPSSDAIDGSFERGIHGSTIIASPAAAPEGVTVCKAFEQEGKCLDCRACWSKDVPVIGYVAHGRTMAKLIAKSAA